MPDTLTPEQIAAIRWQDEQDYERLGKGAFYHTVHVQRRALLAHIDALTAAVEGKITQAHGEYDRVRDDVFAEARFDGMVAAYSAVLAILRGKSATGPNSPKTIVSGK